MPEVFVNAPQINICATSRGWKWSAGDATLCEHVRHSWTAARGRASINHYLPPVWASVGRDHADRRMPIHLLLQGVRPSNEAQHGELLRILLLWLRTLPTYPEGARRTMSNKTRGCDTGEPRRVNARSTRVRKS